ncbi:MAG: helix-hairpin-helix domain-containing protein [Chloroflexota bacterium]
MSFDPSTPFVTNDEIARILFHIASILEMTQDNMFRVTAYRRAALAVMLLSRQLSEYVVQDEDLPLPGVGKSIRGRLKELVNTGRMGVYASLLDELGEPLVSLLALHGIGPKTAMRLVNELHVRSLHDLADAAAQGRIRRLRGFGRRKEELFGRQAEHLLADQAA